MQSSKYIRESTKICQLLDVIAFLIPVLKERLLLEFSLDQQVDDLIRLDDR